MKALETEIKPFSSVLNGVVLTVVDVICGMELDENTVKYTSVFEGKTYYFCGPMCKLEFDSNPQKYADNASRT